MRPIGQLETEEQARVFADYLYLRDIAAEVEEMAAAGWRVWVVDEDQVDEGRALLSRFLSMPDAEEFYRAQDAAKERRREEEKAVTDGAAVKQRAKRKRARLASGQGTLVLISFCLVVGLFSRLGADPGWVKWLQIASIPPVDPFHFWQSLHEVAHGQVWRLFTPVFLHYSLWHLLINLLWLQELGGVLETRLGTRHVLVLMGLLAMVSNLAQYAVVGADQFMGMNGVVYGMLGYYWARQRLDGWNTPVISPVTYGVLVVFLGLGVFGLMGPAANTAHFSGLLAGAGAGWVVSKNGR